MLIGPGLDQLKHALKVWSTGSQPSIHPDNLGPSLFSVLLSFPHP